MMLYTVVNIDIVGSRKLKNRNEIQELIGRYIDKVNGMFEDFLVCPIGVTLGDEWQIVLKSPEVAYDIIEIFQKFLRKHRIETYSGIGIGTISTPIYNDSRKMDGPCFINARNALNIAKAKNRFYNDKLNSKYNRVYFNSEDIRFFNSYNTLCDEEVAVSSLGSVSEIKTLNNVLNSVIENNEVLKSRITEKQWEVIHLYEEMGSYSNIIREKDELTKASISQKLNDSSYFVMKNNRSIIKFLLNLYCEMRRGRMYGV